MRSHEFRMALFAGVFGAVVVLLSLWFFYQFSYAPLGLRIGFSFLVFLLALLTLEFFISKVPASSIQEDHDKEIDRFVKVNEKFLSEREARLKTERDAKEQTEKVGQVA